MRVECYLKQQPNRLRHSRSTSWHTSPSSAPATWARRSRPSPARAATPSSCSAQSDLGTAVTGDIVVLAVPYPAVADVIAQRGEQPGRQDRRRHHQPAELRDLRLPRRARRQLRRRRDRRRAARSRACSRRSTPPSPRTLAAGTVGPLTTTVLIAGDDADAKSTLAGVVTSGGLERHRRRLAQAGPRARGGRLPPAHPRRQREGLLDRRLRRRRLTHPLPRHPTRRNAP